VIAALLITMVAASLGVAYRHPPSFRAAGSAGAGPPQGQLNLAKEYVYAGGRLVATEEPAGGGGGCGTPPSVPGNFQATAQSASSVLVTWDPVAGADHYEVYRKLDAGPTWTARSLDVTGTSFSDSASANTAYLYKVRAVDTAGCFSADTAPDLATTVMFNDDPLLGSQHTIIQAIHVMQLRSAVQAVWATAGLGTPTWTRSSLVGLSVLPVDYTELRTKLNQALTPLGLSQIPADPGIAQGNIIYAVHLQAVREKVR
jgi:hypothetical protein